VPFQTCKISRILTSNYESSYDVATDVLSSQTIIQGVNQYIIQYDVLSIIMIPQGICQRVLLLVSLLQQNGSMQSTTLTASKSITIWLSRNSSYVIGQMLRSRAMTGLKELSFNLWRLPFVLRWNLIY
jgi:hypothetical protein